MKRFLALSLALAVLCSGAYAAAGKKTKPDPMEAVITRTFVDVPLRTAIESVLKGSGIACSVDGDVAAQNLKVTAALKNVSRRHALHAITAMGGVVCSWDKKASESQRGAFRVRSKSKTVAMREKMIGMQKVLFLYRAKVDETRIKLAECSKSSGAEATVLRGSDVVEEQSAVIKLNYISSGDLANALNASDHDRSTTAFQTLGRNRLLVRGDMKFVEMAKVIAQALDTPDALVRAIRVWVVFRYTYAGRESAFTIERVTSEYETVKVDETRSLPDEPGTPPLRRRIAFRAEFTPRLLSRNLTDKSAWPGGKLISLQGRVSADEWKSNGTFAWNTGDVKFAASVSNETYLGGKNGQEVLYKDQATVASGTLESADGAVGYVIKVYADVEAGGLAPK